MLWNMIMVIIPLLFPTLMSNLCAVYLNMASSEAVKWEYTWACDCVCVTEVVAAIDWPSHISILLHWLAGVSACQPSCHRYSSQERSLLQPLLRVCLCCVCYSRIEQHWFLFCPDRHPFLPQSSLFLPFSWYLSSLYSPLSVLFPYSSSSISCPFFPASSIFCCLCFRPYLNWAGAKNQSILPHPCRCVFCEGERQIERNWQPSVWSKRVNITNPVFIIFLLWMCLQAYDLIHDLCATSVQIWWESETVRLYKWEQVKTLFSFM